MVFCLLTSPSCAIIVPNEPEVSPPKALTYIQQVKFASSKQARSIPLLITHRYKLKNIEEAYHLFENKLDGVIKVAVEP